MAELWQVFLNAVMFFTRIPVPAQYSEERLNRASAFFTLVGWLVAAVAVVVWYGAAGLWPNHLALLLSMAATIYLTGAFHEDGFADFCDGFGGGYSRDRILEIMKDSRIGTYGTVGLVLILLTKFVALASLAPALIPAAFLGGHALSRFASTALIYFGEYAREDAGARAKPLATRLSGRGLLVAGLFGVLPLGFLPPASLWLVLPVIATTVWMYRKCRKEIGGYTGDCLGAVQQLTEVVFYLALSANV